MRGPVSANPRCRGRSPREGGASGPACGPSWIGRSRGWGEPSRRHLLNLVIRGRSPRAGSHTGRGRLSSHDGRSRGGGAFTTSLDGMRSIPARAGEPDGNIWRQRLWWEVDPRACGGAPYEAPRLNLEGRSPRRGFGYSVTPAWGSLNGELLQMPGSIPARAGSQEIPIAWSWSLLGASRT